MNFLIGLLFLYLICFIIVLIFVLRDVYIEFEHLMILSKFRRNIAILSYAVVVTFAPISICVALFIYIREYIKGNKLNIWSK